MRINENLIDGFLLKPKNNINLFAFIGPDYGLTNQRVNKLITKLNIDKDDPFNFSQLIQNEVEKDPSKLVDECLTLSLDQSFRVILLKLYGEGFSSSVQASIKNLLSFLPIDNTKIIISAQNVPLSSSLIKKIIDNPLCALIASYQKNQNSIKNYLKSQLIENNIEITNDALDLLSLNLGDDEQNILNKIESIQSYIYPRKVISYSDVSNNIVDTRLIEIENLVFSVFTGNSIQTVRNIDLTISSGINSIEILRVLLSWSTKLKTACEIYKSTKSVEKAVQLSTSFIFWKIKPKFENSIKLCIKLDFDNIIDRLLALENKIKSQPQIGNTLLSYSLIGISELVKKND